MSQVHFDPFSNRLARDIRNNLSRSFIKSLAEKDVSFFQKCAAEYLQQKLDPIYEQYITLYWKYQLDTGIIIVLFELMNSEI